MNDLYQTVRRIARDELYQQRGVELGVVQEQHPHADDGDDDNYSCTVLLRDSGIVLPRVPVATGMIGAVSIPAVNDLVLVQFIGGDVHAPVIVGRLYNDEDRPPANADGQFVLHRPLGASDDDAVHLELTSGDERGITLKIGSALTLDLKDDDPVVSLSVDGGKAVLKIDRDGAVTVESEGNLSLKGSEVKIAGSTIEIAADGELNLTGATVNLN
jgi:uncharacterized protein involved in type VI secretion and phage assembly